MGFSAEQIGVVCGRVPSAGCPLVRAVAIATTRDLGFSAEVVLGPLAFLGPSWPTPIPAHRNGIEWIDILVTLGVPWHISE